MNKKKVIELISEADICFTGYLRNGCKDLVQMGVRKLHDAQEELLYTSDWTSVENGLPPVDKEVIVITTTGRISFGHIVDKKIAKDYNGWNIPDVEYWLPFVDPKEE